MDWTSRDPTANRHGGNEYSSAAHDSIVDDKENLRNWFHDLIDVAGVVGMTADEVEVTTGIRAPTVSARFTELKEECRIVWIGKRPTRSGRFAGVYVSREVYDMHGELKPGEPDLSFADDFIGPEPEQIELVQNGRYQITPADGGKVKAMTRATTWADTLDDADLLIKYSSRQTAIGLAARPDLLALVAGTDPTDRQALNALCERAKQAVAADSRANLGTAQHRFVECRLKGEAVHVPTDLIEDVDAVIRALDQYGLKPLHIEVVVVCNAINVAGKADFIVVNADGELFIADLKTGEGLTEYAQLRTALQLAIYANADSIYDPVTATHAPMPAVRRDVAYALSCPIGSRECKVIEVDIAAGWEYASELVPRVRGARNHGRRKNGLFRDLINPSPPEMTADELLPKEALRAWIVRRFAVLAKPEHAAAQAAARGAWPAGVPGLKSTHDHSEPELRLLSRLLDAVEREYSIPFGETSPEVTQAIADRTTEFLEKLAPTSTSAASLTVYATATATEPNNVVQLRPDTAGDVAREAPTSPPAVLSVVGAVTPPDEEGEAPAELVAGALALIARQPAGALMRISGWLVEAKAAGLDFSLKRLGSERRLAIYKALIALAPLIDPEDSERVRATIALIDPTAAHPSAPPVGVIIGRMSKAEALDLNDSVRFVVANDPALCYSPDGTVRWDANTVLRERDDD